MGLFFPQTFVFIQKYFTESSQSSLIAPGWYAIRFSQALSNAFNHGFEKDF